MATERITKERYEELTAKYAAEGEMSEEFGYIVKEIEAQFEIRKVIDQIKAASALTIIEAAVKVKTLQAELERMTEMVDDISIMAPCPICDGSGKAVPAERGGECEMCEGLKQVQIIGNLSQLRAGFVEYVSTEGCGCCSHSDHKTIRENMADMLCVPKFPNGQHNFYAVDSVRRLRFVLNLPAIPVDLEPLLVGKGVHTAEGIPEGMKMVGSVLSGFPIVPKGVSQREYLRQPVKMKVSSVDEDGAGVDTHFEITMLMNKVHGDRSDASWVH